MWRTFWWEKAAKTQIKIRSRTSFAGPSFSGEIYNITQQLKNILVRKILITARSPEKYIDELFPEGKISDLSEYNVLS